MQIDQDNIIQLVFDKAFSQITIDSEQLKIMPFSIIKSQTFENKFIHDMISNLTQKKPNVIGLYLTNDSFLRKYLFSKLKNKIDVNILLNDLDQIKNLDSCRKCKECKIISNPLSMGYDHSEGDDLLCQKYQFLIENAFNIEVRRNIFSICDDLEIN